MSLGTSPSLPPSHASQYDTIIIMKTSKWVSEQGSEKKAANSVRRIFPSSLIFTSFHKHYKQDDFCRQKRNRCISDWRQVWNNRYGTISAKHWKKKKKGMQLTKDLQEQKQKPASQKKETCFYFFLP